jgi:hypothetical protein
VVVDHLHVRHSAKFNLLAEVGPLAESLVRQGRGEAFGEFRCLAQTSTILHLADLVVLDRAPWAPHQPHDDRASDRRYDLSARTYARLHNALALLEDRPGLIRAVSGGSVPPPEMAPLGASPVQIRIE